MADNESIYCDEYPLSTYEQLVAEAAKNVSTIKGYYNEITLGITPEIFDLINKLQMDIDKLQSDINDLQSKFENTDEG